MPHTYSASVSPLQGFHFALTTHLHAAVDAARDAGCTAPTLALRFVLPPSVFADPYELDLHETAFRYHMSYEPDLERPARAVRDEDVLLDISAPLPVPRRQAESGDEFSVVVPMHSRYPRPKEGHGEAFEDIWLEPPTASIVCGQDASDATLTPLTYVPSPHSPYNDTRLHLRVPLGTTSHLRTVELNTVLVIFGAFVYLMRVCVQTARRLSTGTRDTKQE